MSASDAPLALVGYSVAAARALRELGFTAVHVPSDDLGRVLEACQTLRFSGALVHASQEVQALACVQVDSTARKVGRVDCVAFAGGAHGAFALADALTDALDASGYATRGASAVLLGLDAHDLALALPLARLGFSDIGMAAESLPEAERAARDLPAGVRVYAMSRRDADLRNLAERADLVVLTGGGLPSGLLQPYHTLVDLTGQAGAAQSGATLLDLSDLPARRLVRQVAHATGQRLHADELSGVLHALS